MQPDGEGPRGARLHAAAFAIQRVVPSDLPDEHVSEPRAGTLDGEEDGRLAPFVSLGAGLQRALVSAR